MLIRNLNKYLSNVAKSSVLGLVLFTLPLAGIAESDLCAPFKHTSVDESVVEKMLSAAEHGHLYRIVPSSSQVGFCVDSPIGRVEGVFKDFTGGLTFVPNMFSDQQQAMVKVYTSSLDTNKPGVEGMLKSKSFFDIADHPEMLFVSREFRWLNEAEAILIGDLTLRGITREVGFHVRLIEKNEANEPGDQQRLQVKATTLISRSEFGIKSLAPIVGDAVSLCMTVEAVKYSTSQARKPGKDRGRS